MLKRYHTLLGSLDNAEAILLEDHMRELRRVIRPGAKRLNWNSLGISEFVAKCDSVSTKYTIIMLIVREKTKPILFCCPMTNYLVQIWTYAL